MIFEFLNTVALIKNTDMINEISMNYRLLGVRSVERNVSEPPPAFSSV